MLNNILDFSKIQKGKIKFNFEKIETASFINSVIEKFKLSIKEQKFEFLINIPNSLPLINGDKNSLIRVLNNLLDNAVKYSGENQWISISAFIKGKYMAIRIQDKGIGIPKKYYKKIFKHFFRIEDKKQTIIKGTGLGLAMVKYIVENHHGKIMIQSAINKGTAFTVFLPI